MKELDADCELQTRYLVHTSKIMDPDPSSNQSQQEFIKVEATSDLFEYEEITPTNLRSGLDHSTNKSLAISDNGCESKSKCQSNEPADNTISRPRMESLNLSSGGTATAILRQNRLTRKLKRMKTPHKIAQLHGGQDQGASSSSSHEDKDDTLFEHPFMMPISRSHRVNPSDVGRMSSQSQDNYPDFQQCRTCSKEFATYTHAYRKAYEKHIKSHNPPKGRCSKSSAKTGGGTTMIANAGTSCQSNDAVAVVENSSGETTTMVCPHCLKTFTDLAARGRHIRLMHRNSQVDTKTSPPVVHCTVPDRQNTEVVSESRTIKSPTVSPEKRQIEGSNKEGYQATSTPKHSNDEFSHQAMQQCSNPTSLPFPCLGCGKNFPDARSRGRHTQRVHQGTEEFENSSSSSVSEETPAEYAHFGQKKQTKVKPDQRVRRIRYRCPSCNKGFVSLTGQVTHNHRFHCPKSTLIPAANRYECGRCSKQFDTRYKLRSHEESHRRGDAAGPPFKCKLCPKVFQLQSQLSGHLACHRKVNNNEQVKVKKCRTRQETRKQVKSSIGPSPSRISCENIV